MYAIAGYQKLVTAKNLTRNNCTRSVMKKVVYTCVPKAYNFDFAKIEKWAYIDIAVAKVESPYDFFDSVWADKCSYAPQPIRINYDRKYQKPGIDTMVHGWGHKDIWRKPGDTSNHNRLNLRYASTLIYDTEKCKKSFQEIGPMAQVIEKYMICTLGSGNIDEKGDPISTPNTFIDGCSPSISRMLDGELVCEEDDYSVASESRKTLSRILARQQNMTRRQGICQNDHGGPLVTWVGGHEVLIGVASVFRVTEDYQCTGPFLYTSTYCNGLFLDCVINDYHKGDNNEKKTEKPEKDKKYTEATKKPDIGKYTDINYEETEKPGKNKYDEIRKNFPRSRDDAPQGDRTRRYEICNKPPAERGFDMLEKHISWTQHPEGPADKLMKRPQIPLYL